MLDYFDDDLNYLGSAPRGEVHAKGLWHRSFHCWIIRREGDQAYVVLQKRSADKDTFPNLLDISAAGHIVSGETIADGIREVNEELGIGARYEDLIPLGIRCSTAVYAQLVDRQFSHVYLLHYDAPLTSYRPQAEEVSAVVQVSISDLMRLYAGEVSSIPAVGVAVDSAGNTMPIEMQVSQGDFVPCKDGYYMMVCI